MIAKVDSYVCFCDKCGCRIGDGEEEQYLLFNYYDEAIRYAERIGWSVTKNGNVLCDDCKKEK